jgi:hypothetical protein
VPDSPKPPGHDDQNSSDLIRLMLLLARIFPAYCRAVTAAIQAQAVHAANPHLVNDPGYKRLLSFEAMMWLFVIWRTSVFASPEACETAGVPHGAQLPRVTCNMLGEAALNDLDLPEDVAGKMGPEGFIMNCRRVVDGAIEFGFVTKEEVRANYKPLEATRELHDLMMSLMQDYRTP